MISGRYERHLLDNPVRLRFLLALIHTLDRAPHFLLLLLLLVSVKQGGVAILSLLLLFFGWG